jgi:hypothetical protein
MAYASKSASDDLSKPGPYWHKQLEEAEAYFKEFRTKGDRIIKRYRDERQMTEQKRRKFNILWSNVQVLKPALYGKQAKPDVQRRHNDNDPVGRVASMMLERAIVYEIEQRKDFDQAMSGIVDDRLLPGLGVAWVRYEPTIVQVEGEEGAQVTDDEEASPNERVVGAHSPCDYVHWKDYLCSPARTEEEVWWRSRYVYMTSEEGVERFGDIFKQVPLEYDATQQAGDGKAKKDLSDKKAKVAEIWNKRTGKVCWVACGYPHALDERDDPLQLEGFFPCTLIAATTTTDSVIPVPDYCQYQDQAEELDTYTQRIHSLTKAVKANGVYNAEFKSIKRLLNEGVDNTMEPVDAWAAFAEKGGLKGAMDLMNTDPIIKALEVVVTQREVSKQTIYEVTGMSDVIRGATNPNETLGAQQLKASFGSLRLKASQMDVARAASDLFKIKAQLICKFYPPEVIREMSGIAQTLDGQNEQIVQEALALLKNSKLRDWRINVESDSLAQLDEMSDRQARVEAVATVGTFMKNAFPVVQQAPQLIPAMSETMQFLMRGFRVAKPLETAWEEAMQAAAQAAQEAAANPQPDPKVQAEQMKAKAEVEKAQIGSQVAREKAQLQIGVAREKAQIDSQKNQAEFAIEQERAQAQRENDMAGLAIEGERMRMEERHARAMPAPKTRQ